MKITEYKTYENGRKTHQTKQRKWRRQRNWALFAISMIVISGALAGHAYALATQDTNTQEKTLSASNLGLQVTSSTPAVVVKEPTMQDYVLNEVEKAGLNKYEAYIIINCESRWNNNAINVNKNGSVDMGIWQLNTIHKSIANADKYDYKKATAFAIAKRIHDGNWKAWSCAKAL